MAVGEWHEGRLVERGWAIGLKACWVLGVLALGCGGQATKNEAGGSGAAAGGTEAGGTAGDGVLPTRGFYRKTVVTRSNSCSWSGTAAGDVVLVGASQAALAAPLGPSNLQQEVPWRGLSLELPGCNAVIAAHVVSHSETEFVIDVAEDWPMPDKCGLMPA